MGSHWVLTAALGSWGLPAVFHVLRNLGLGEVKRLVGG